MLTALLPVLSLSVFLFFVFLVLTTLTSLLCERVLIKTSLMHLPNNLKYYFNSRLFRFGLPFVALVVGGSFGLKYFSEIRYKYLVPTQILFLLHYAYNFWF